MLENSTVGHDVSEQPWVTMLVNSTLLSNFLKVVLGCCCFFTPFHQHITNFLCSLDFPFHLCIIILVLVQDAVLGRNTSEFD
jgi:hypothetical protein